MALSDLAEFLVSSGPVGLTGLKEGFHFGYGRLYERLDCKQMLIDGFDIPPESVVADVTVIKLDTIKEETSYDHT